jgi:hypothetical protein
MNFVGMVSENEPSGSNISEWNFLKEPWKDVFSDNIAS